MKRLKDPIRSISQELKVTAIQSLKASKDKWKEQLILREKLPEQRFEVEDELLLAKGKAFGTMKTGAFQTKWYGPCLIVVANHSVYDFIITNERVS